MKEMERVTSRQNAIVKRFRDAARGRAEGVLLDGGHLVQEALDSGVPVELAAFSDRQFAGAESPLTGLARRVEAAGGRPLLVSEQVLAAISPVRQPSGVVAIGRAGAAAIGAAVAAARGGAALPLVIALAGVQDPGNVGAIVRAAAAFGAAGIIAIEGTANPFGWKALRGAMGGTFRLPVAAGGGPEAVLDAAREQRLRILAAVPRGGTPLPRIDFHPPSLLVLGGEGAGVSAAMLAAADETVTIPMRSPVESLNVASAAALVLYEAARQLTF